MLPRLCWDNPASVEVLLRRRGGDGVLPPSHEQALSAAQPNARYETRVFGSIDELAEQRVAAIIAANSPAQPLAWTRRR